MNRSHPAKPVKCVEEGEEEEREEGEKEKKEEGEEDGEEGGGELGGRGKTVLLCVSPSLGLPSQKALRVLPRIPVIS